MNKENMFYPHSLECQIKWYFRMEVKFGLWIRWFLVFIPLPVLAIWLPYCYICDIIANVMDWLCMKYFVDFPLWAYRKMDEEGIKQ